MNAINAQTLLKIQSGNLQTHSDELSADARARVRCTHRQVLASCQWLSPAGQRRSRGRCLLAQLPGCAPGQRGTHSHAVGPLATLCTISGLHWTPQTWESNSAAVPPSRAAE